MNKLSNSLFFDRVTVVWIVLVVATVFSWWIGVETGHSSSVRISSLLLIAAAFVKTHLVIRYFMEVRQAPLALKLICDAWVLVVGLSVALLQYVTW